MIKTINVVEIIKEIKDNESNTEERYLLGLFDTVEGLNRVKIEEINLVGDFVTGTVLKNNLPFTFYWGRKYDGSDHITVTYNSSSGFDGFNKKEKERFKNLINISRKCLS